MFTEYGSEAKIVNSNSPNVMLVMFKPSVMIPTTGKLVLKIPTKTFGGVTLFDNDLGSGISSGNKINCFNVQNFVGTLSCTLTHGDQLIGSPALITINGFTTNLAITSTYKFYLDGFKNPISGGDNKHVETTLEGYDGSNNLINWATAYDFTIIDFAITP